ncbi:unnamed protein product [Rotaria socialis]|uniref:VCBS repeat-containing protein n=1 Tax=Rotaria socialis TaxID=392032 RepID=A0A820S1S7_9BILA|nr:unnamed protein product [Rotaria socialis]CAF3444082.1 unnamed protein product [Rotaria socialis]CAF3485864.1 unnamed protein product [Rotaria socialis]CAF3636517.1 unnamed protein product [Rotaria socialis]CAF3654786.1 unnamed protein product [Rotaria socialis]
MTYPTGTGSYPYSVVVSDFNNDTALDIVVVNEDTNNVGVFLGYGSGTFSIMILFSMGYGSRAFSAVAGDFNADTKLNLVVANDGTDNLYVF